MARKRPVMPSIAAIKALEGIGSTKVEKSLLRALNLKGGEVTSASTPSRSGAVLTARARAQRAMTYEMALNIQNAKEGDDSGLLPYQPTPSINPPRPRTLAAGYDRENQILRIRFRPGAIYSYANVSPREWRNFRAVKSPGRAVNRTLNFKEYWRETW